MNFNGNHKSINYSRQKKKKKQTSILQKKIIKMQGKKWKEEMNSEELQKQQENK